LILVDANLLVYAYATSLPQHDAAREWLDARLNDTPRVGLPWPSLLTFVRLVSNPRIFERAIPVGEAWRQVERWLQARPSWIPLPTDRHRHVVDSLLGQIGGQANLVPDVHLAAVAIEHGLTLCSTDSDYARFSGLRWQNPIAG
jgi:hypothetical protein